MSDSSTPTNAHETSSGALVVAVVLAASIFIVGTGIILEINSRQPEFDLFVPLLALGIASVTVPAVAIVPGVRNWLERATAQRRVGIILGIVIPALIVVMGTVVLWPAQHQPTFLRIVFLLSVCLFPPSLYYLFIAAKKEALLAGFFLNLDRLGLFRIAPSRQPSPDRQRPDLADRHFQQRLQMYIEKFEDSYGLIQDRLVDKILETMDPVGVLLEERKNHRTLVEFDVFNINKTAPVVGATILITLGWLVVLPPVPDAGQANSWANAFVPHREALRFAFLGAYFFSIQMLFRRFFLGDLKASAYIAVSVRIILAVIGTWAAIEAVLWGQAVASGGAEAHPPGQWSHVLGFAVGVFPKVAWQFIAGAAKKIPNMDTALPSMRTQLPLGELDGFTVWSEARFEEEGIESIPNMASANLVELMLHTRYPGHQIIDWVDQSVLYTCLGPESPDGKSRRAKLRAHGIRTASGLIEAYDRHAKEKKTLPSFKKILACEPASEIETLVVVMRRMPNVRRIQHWYGWGQAKAGGGNENRDGGSDMNSNRPNASSTQ